MLRAYIDDSGQGHGPVMVLAGFISTSERWAAFSDEWQEALDMRPQLQYFKMSEAVCTSGEFYAWSEERRDERVSLFYRILERHVQAGIWTSMPRDSYASTFSPIAQLHRQYKNPYYILVLNLLAEFQRNKDRINITEPVEFIFDNQMGAKDKVMEAWQFFESNPLMMELLGKPPNYQDDKQALPLQAADIHAWWVRARFDAAMSGKPMASFRFKNQTQIPMVGFEWTDARLQRACGTMLAAERQARFGNIPPAVLFDLGLWPPMRGRGHKL